MRHAVPRWSGIHKQGQRCIGFQANTFTHTTVITIKRLQAPPEDSRLQQKIDLGSLPTTSSSAPSSSPAAAHRPTKASYLRLFIAKQCQCAGTRAIVRAEQNHSW